ncbi:MAG: copper chaperone PCu(A)C [Streptosporangiales bacterium]|nr:copper chaperone PCu(A)C [Streptosporangiales bacterium]
MRSRGRVARGPALAVAAALVSLLAGCAGSGGDAAQSVLANGENASLRGILLRNVFVLGPGPGETIPAGESAPIYLVLINGRAQPDDLVSVTAPGTARSVEIPGDRLTLPVSEPVRPGEGGPPLTLQDLTRNLSGGQYVRLAFEFEQAGTVEVNTPVMPYADLYTSFPAPTSPPPSPTASPTGSPTGSPGPASERAGRERKGGERKGSERKGSGADAETATPSPASSG